MGQIGHPELTGVHFDQFRWLISERALFRDFRLFARHHQRWLGQFSCFYQAPILALMFARGANSP